MLKKKGGDKMINSISNSNLTHNISNIQTNKNVSRSTAEEANESTSQKIAEANGQNSKIASNHVIDTYA